ncbi:MAG TPA: hypothetical protein VEJ41_05475, partial [Candidatus Acidoferrales bacterium]|nr:hypothetical protein [Candidatus Acidoferrales bacterium]
MTYDDYNSQGESASATNVLQLVTYAQGGYGNDKALNDCHSVTNGCKAVFYMNPNRLYDGDGCAYLPATSIMPVAQESWFLHDTGYSDSAHRVWGYQDTDPDSCDTWIMNINSSGYQAWWQTYLWANADQWDLYFLDDDSMELQIFTEAHSGGGCLPWPSYCTSTQEI